MQKKDVNEYFSGLTPELREKAMACKSVDELLRFADDNDLEVPVDALQGVAGGCGDVKCGYCGSSDLEYVGVQHVGQYYLQVYKCKQCGKETKR